MSQAADAVREIPAHIPLELVRDFDFYALGGEGVDVHRVWKRVQEEEPEIFWTPRNGGHWVVTRAAQIAEVQDDWEHFSQGATSIPRPTTPIFRPINLDPPEHGPYRRLIMPAFLPKNVQRLEQVARDLAVELIEGFKDRGECEFMEDFARKLPASVFMHMVDLPKDDLDKLIPLSEMVARGGGAVRAQAYAQMKAYINDFLDKRRNNPGDDLVSKIIHSEIDGRPLNEEEVDSMVLLLLFGGLDTVASMMGYVAWYLAEHPEQRQWLCENLTNRLPDAIDELIRRNGVSNTGRIVVSDYDFHGVQLKAGDMIQQPNCLYGLDERVNDDPLHVDFKRARVNHRAFGGGAHSCPGNVLARREIQVFLEEWLPRIPEFRIKSGTSPVTKTGLVNSVEKLHLSW